MNTHMTEWIASVIGEKEIGAIPVLTHLGVEMTGASLREAVTDGEVHARAVCKLAELYPTMASTMMMDLSVEAEAFGANVFFSERRMPDVEGRLLSDARSVDVLDIPTLDAGRIPAYLRANEIVAAQTDRPMLSGCIGPFSLAGRLFGMTEIMMALFLESECIHRLLQKCMKFIASYCQALREAGSNGVLMAEPAAGLLSGKLCAEFSSAYVREIVREVQRDDFVVILHNCGNTGHCTDAMVRSGARALHFGNRADMVEALKACPPDLPVLGNIDPVGIFQQASPEQVYAAVSALLEKTAPYDNFILSSGCDVPPHTPLENIQAFYKALNDYNEK